MSRPPDVFISHRDKPHDTKVASDLKKRLATLRIDSFLDTKDICGGEPLAHVIIDNVKRSRVVVVLMGEMSPWLYFEASCAYFDHKLFPVSVGGDEVPLPFSKSIHYDTIHMDDNGNGHPEDLARIAKEVQRRLHGSPMDRVFTLIYNILNRFFSSGLQILFVAVSAIVLLGFLPGTGYAHIYHLHVALGAAMLGGQFFLSLAFAKAVSSPSFRERDYGFKISERLFWFWMVIALSQPLLGLWLVSPHAVYSIVEWVWLSLVLYLLAMLFTVGGYIMAKSAMDRDHNDASARAISSRYLRANLLFLLGFVLTVGVMNVMIKKPLPQNHTDAANVSQMECSAIWDHVSQNDCH